MLILLSVCCVCKLAARQKAWWIVGFIVPSPPRGDKMLVYMEVDVAAVGTAV